MTRLTLMVPVPTVATVVLYAEVCLTPRDGDDWHPPFYIDIGGLLSDEVTDAIYAELGGMVGDRLLSLRAQEAERNARAAEDRKIERLGRLTKIAGGAPVCVACGQADASRLEIDHIVPRSKGGGNNLDNLQVLCRDCNGAKGARTMAEWVGAQS